MHKGLAAFASACLMTSLLTACGGGGGGPENIAPPPDVWREYGTEMEVALRYLSINDAYFGYNRARYVGGTGYVYQYTRCSATATSCAVSGSSGTAWGGGTLHAHYLLTAEGLLNSSNTLSGFRGTFTFGPGGVGFYHYNNAGISTPAMETISAEFKDVGGLGVLAFLKQNKAALAGTDFVDELTDLTGLGSVAALEDNVFDSRAKGYLETHVLHQDYGWFSGLSPLATLPDGYVATTLHGQTVYEKDGSTTAYLLKDAQYYSGRITRAGTWRVLTWNDYAAADLKALITELRALP